MCATSRLFGTDWFGSWLIERFGVSLDTLIWANSITTAITVPLVLLLPAVIVGRRDAESAAEAVAAAPVSGLAEAKERAPW